MIIPRNRLISSVKTIVDIVVDSTLEILRRDSISNCFYCWSSYDEQTTVSLFEKLQNESFDSDSSVISKLLENDGIRPRHVVAASTLASVKARNIRGVGRINDNAVKILAVMHDKRPETKRPPPMKVAPITAARLPHPSPARHAPAGPSIAVQIDQRNAPLEFPEARGFTKLRSF
ncbi:MAG: hypothetical protein M3247_08330 [Thermoproteota archaeon]|nr:hypothetical protein [Thermoproteota archaeon]